jgi:hypothetical protein
VSEFAANFAPHCTAYERTHRTAVIKTNYPSDVSTQLNPYKQPLFESYDATVMLSDSSTNSTAKCATIG